MRFYRVGGKLGRVDEHGAGAVFSGGVWIACPAKNATGVGLSEAHAGDLFPDVPLHGAPDEVGPVVRVDERKPVPVFVFGEDGGLTRKTDTVTASSGPSVTMVGGLDMKPTPKPKPAAKKKAKRKPRKRKGK